MHLRDTDLLRDLRLRQPVEEAELEDLPFALVEDAEAGREHGAVLRDLVLVLDLAQGLLHIVLWSSVLFGMATVFSGMMRASGTVLMPLLISIFAIAVIEVPVAVILSRAIGIEGVWAAYPITFTAMFILQMSYYMLVWRKRTVRRLI